MPGADGLLNHDLDPQDRGPQDACGVFGVWAPNEEVAKLTYFGLYALQHRGQESAGIAVSKGQQILVHKDMGLVSQVFDENALNTLRDAHLAIGHCRYSTTGSSVWDNAQPTFRSTATGHIALGHNGNLTNTLELREWLTERDEAADSLIPGSLGGLHHRHLVDHRAAVHLPRPHDRAGRDGGAAAAARRVLAWSSWTRRRCTRRATRRASGRWCSAGWSAAGSWPARPPRWTSSARPTSARSIPAS